MNYRLYVSNQSELVIRPIETVLEKDGLKLADPARKGWPAIEPRNVATLSWQPSRNPMEFVTIKWRERMAGKEPPPSHRSIEEIDVAITFTVPGGRRIVHHERIMALGTTVTTPCSSGRRKSHKTTGWANTGSVARYAL
jgi:hypothetical protein